ncbi:MAG: tRNA uridine-5-carboxymethylaminomethyl(34) synthesis GTPase MnmE [Bdellovibrionales bacterium]
MFHHDDTIFALASAPGRAGVSVVRVSGSRCLESFSALSQKHLEPRMATLCRLKEPVSRETIDQALVLYFANPASYTGECLVEYHLHGGRAVVDSMLAYLQGCHGHRLAEPGEFTRRAFENGKMDLTEAEAVADLIDAQTQAQRIQALSQIGGALSELYESWSESLKKMLAHIEADIEFPDEDMPEGILPTLLPKIELLSSEISAHLDDNRRGERLRDGVKIVIVGAPNAGKSSLLNLMAKREAAIVSDMAGTTRDVIDVHLDLDGYPVILSDTAGLRPEELGQDAQGLVEKEGIKRAIDLANSADIKILLFDGSSDDVDQGTLDLCDDQSIVAVNKCDEKSSLFKLSQGLEISVKSGDGIDSLLEKLTETIKELVGYQETPALTRERHRVALMEAQECMVRSLSGALPELVAEDLRLAIRALGRITGRVDVEDLLDVVFRDFCIGK